MDEGDEGDKRIEQGGVDGSDMAGDHGTAHVVNATDLSTTDDDENRCPFAEMPESERAKSDMSRWVEDRCAQMPRRMRDTATFYLYDRAIAEQMVQYGCHLLATSDECAAWGEWAFSDLHAAQMAVYFYLLQLGCADMARYVRDHDWTQPPAPLPASNKGIRTFGYSNEQALHRMAHGSDDDDDDDDDEQLWGFDDFAPRFDHEGHPLDMDSARLTRTRRPLERWSLRGWADETQRAGTDEAGLGLHAEGQRTSAHPGRDAANASTHGEQTWWAASAPDARETSTPDTSTLGCTEEDDDREARRDGGYAAPHAAHGSDRWEVFEGGRAAWDEHAPERACERDKQRQRERQAREADEASMQQTLILTTVQVALLLGVARTGVLDWAKRHDMPVFKDGGSNYYRLDDVMARVTAQRHIGHRPRPTRRKFKRAA